MSTRPTLQEALHRARTLPKRGDYEFCRQIGGDGVIHMFVVADVQHRRGQLPEITYMIKCGASKVLDLARWEVAGPDEACNCLTCVT
jgi:hypothetical protein